MIGLLIISHGTLGESLIHCASHMLNKRPPRLRQIGVTAQDDPGQLVPQARKMVKELDEGDGVLVLTDMYGGSPSNIAAKLVIPGKIEAVAGVNLPMLIKLASVRSTDTLQNAAVAAQDAGRKYINVASALLAQEKQKTKKAN